MWRILMLPVDALLVYLAVVSAPFLLTVLLWGTVFLLAAVIVFWAVRTAIRRA